MNSKNIKDLADAMANMLISNAAHGYSTSSINGMGEITLRDSMIVASASIGAKIKQAWIIDREIVPTGWIDAAVDVVVSRDNGTNNYPIVGGSELKWWRQNDQRNASNRRRDLIKDFIRAASFYQQVEAFSFVGLLSLTDSWDATTTTSGSDSSIITTLNSPALQKWNLTKLSTSSGVKGAIKLLNGKVPIPNIVHFRLLSSVELSNSSSLHAFAKIWEVKKPQNSKILSQSEIANLIK